MDVCMQSLNLGWLQLIRTKIWSIMYIYIDMFLCEDLKLFLTIVFLWSIIQVQRRREKGQNLGQEWIRIKLKTSLKLSRAYLKTTCHLPILAYQMSEHIHTISKSAYVGKQGWVNTQECIDCRTKYGWPVCIHTFLRADPNMKVLRIIKYMESRASGRIPNVLSYLFNHLEKHISDNSVYIIYMFKGKSHTVVLMK